MSTPSEKPSQETRGAEGLSLGLRIPDQLPAPPDSFLLDPKTTTEWFESLPVANIGETARLVFNALVDCNRMEIPDLVRARVIELFREPVAYLCGNLERHFLDMGFPLSQKGRKTALLGRALNSELALGYKIIIERLLKSDVKRFDEKLMVVALHRAVYYLCEVLYRSAVVYEPWPPGVWRELHSLYAYASQNKVHAVPVKDALATRSRSNTIENVYRRALLFSTTNPLRLRQTEIRRVYQVLDLWAPRVELKQPIDDPDVSAVFSFDIWGDMPPVHGSLVRPPLTRRTRLFDVRRLVQNLREQFDQEPSEAEPGENQEQLVRPLLRRLISDWVSPSQRRYVRTHLNFDLDLLVGLTAIHQVLTGDEPAASSTVAEQQNPAQTRKVSSPRVPAWADASPGGLSLSPLDSTLASEPTLRDPRFTGANLANEKEAAVDWTSKSSSSKPQTPYPVQTFNESAGGYCLRWASDHPAKVRIGEILGVRTPGEKPSFAVGTVRWIKQDPERELEIGVQVMAARCQPGELSMSPKAKGGKTPKQPLYPCLLLPESQAGDHETSLLTNAPNLDTGAAPWLLVRGEQRRIKLLRVLETSGSYRRHEFRLASPERPEQTRSGPTDQSFDDLWDSL